MQAEALARHLALTGPANFRDIGGYEAEGGFHTRWRRVFRSDSLHHVTDADLEHLESHGISIRTGFDLRTARELEQTGHGPMFANGGRHLHLPFVAEVKSIGPDRDFRALGDLYLHMIEEAHASVRAVFEALADRDSYPAVYYCSAGKDRTGLLTALILGTLGVSEDQIVADYALTDDHMSVVLAERFEKARQARLEREAREASEGAAPHEQQPQPSRQLDPEMLRARPDTMRAFLGGLDATYGSVAGYIAACGVSEKSIAALKAHLLE